MQELTQVLRTAVNTWECDEMGHLNVRFYPAHETQAIRMLLSRCGAPPAWLRARHLRLAALEKHIRFQRELRPRTPFCAFAGFLEVSEHGLSTYCELRRAADGEPCATILGRYALCAASGKTVVPIEAGLQQRAAQYLTSLPPHGAPRGVEAYPPRPSPRLEEAIALGMYGGYLGAVDAQHVDEAGFIEPAGHIARISDGVQHVFLSLSDQRLEGIGGAVLEFRLVHRQLARPGDQIEIRSGLKQVGPKTRNFCHWIFDACSGACLATSEVVAVRFDLQARKALAFAPEDLPALRAQVIPELSC